MGNSSLKSFEHGYIYVQTDKSVYMPGETISGNVHIQLTMPYPAEFLQLEIKGKEKTMHVGKRMKKHIHLGGR